jgi:predicted Zn-dependent peptidase
MKRILLLLLVSGAALRAQQINVPDMQREQLDNGLTVIMMPYHKVPVITLRLMVRGGSAHDPDRMPGVASMTTSLMREGTAQRTSTQIAEEIDFIGGSLSAGASVDYCAVNAEVMSKDIETGLALFADVVLNPSFPPEEIEREREQRLAALEALKEEPSALASTVFNREVYGGHPYGRRSAGTPFSLNAISREHLTEFYQSVFVPQRSVLVAVGDFENSEMLARLKRAFGSWKKKDGKDLSLPEAGRLTGREVIVVDKPDATQAQILVGNIGVDIRNSDYFALLVANTVFGGGFTSRLIDELRVKRSLTYGAYSGFPSSLAGGTFVISTFTKNETLTEMLDAIMEQLALYRKDGPTEEEIEKAKNYMAGSYARGLQSPGTLASRITDVELYQFPGDYLETYIDRIRSVQNTDIRKSIANHFPLDDLLFVVVAPASESVSRVEKFDKPTVLGLDEAVR